ncbi:MAG: 3-dehydroquinate synthase [Synergistaceae bacterium]|jgi:3-dehydroquinate synthase|nr:3-dehydroquinate synthase [Synergistaceae bacterium]
MNRAGRAERLTVGLGDGGYDILIGSALIESVGDLLRPLCCEGGEIAVVTDENVWMNHVDALSSSMDRAGLGFQPIVMPEGEGSKSISGLEALYNSFARMKLTRFGLAVAFGGGVVGDLCGFAAATWMRGVRFVQVPTTLLAQVDSSVGGKTGINLAHGKNIVGAFYQPKLVVIDPLTLRTLPDREVRCGMAEVVKYGAIRSESLFETLRERSEPDISSVIRECCAIKSEIAARDERDFGERMLLNFGHTLGHAIEKHTGFGKYRHGEAVAFGMVMASALGERMGVTSPGVTRALGETLALYGLETRYPGDAADLVPLLSLDKKSVGGAVRMVFLRKIGTAFVRRVKTADLERLLKGAEELWRM